jgi:hypothetical protein
MNPEPTATEPTPTGPTHRPRRVRRVLAIAAGVAMVPALYAAASAATGGGGGSATVEAARHSAAEGTELENEHGVVVEKPHGGAPTPSVPEATTPSVSQATTPTAPEATTPSEPEPGDDNGVDGPGHDVGDDHGNDGDGVTSPAPATSQSFSSVGGSITVSVTDGALSLTSSTPAAGFSAEVHDNGPSRVEVRFSDGQTEWRIRIELGSGGLTSEITQHG